MRILPNYQNSKENEKWKNEKPGSHSAEIFLTLKNMFLCQIKIGMFNFFAIRKFRFVSPNEPFVTPFVLLVTLLLIFIVEGLIFSSIGTKFR